jgi:hypothetical protein
MKHRINFRASVWSEQEDALLREHYVSKGGPWVTEQLTERTYKAVQQRAVKLGLKHRSHKYWTTKEDRLLIEHFPAMGRKTHDLFPGRTLESVLHRAVTLGVKSEVKRGPAPRSLGVIGSISGGAVSSVFDLGQKVAA